MSTRAFVTVSINAGCHQSLSYDQLWAASLIGRNAVTWRWAYVHIFTVTRGDMIMSPGWQCQQQIYIEHNLKVSNGLCTLVKREKKVFRSRRKLSKERVTDLAGSLVTSSRPPGRLQKRPDDRTSNAGVAVRTADGSRRTADAGDLVVQVYQSVRWVFVVFLFVGCTDSMTRVFKTWQTDDSGTGMLAVTWPFAIGHHGDRSCTFRCAGR